MRPMGPISRSALACPLVSPAATRVGSGHLPCPPWKTPPHRSRRRAAGRWWRASAPRASRSAPSASGQASPASTFADRVVMLGETARPEHVVGRDGRRYRPVRGPRDPVAESLRQELLDTIATGRPACPRDPGDRTLQRLLVVDQLRMVARSVVDAAPFSDTERDVIGRYLLRIGRGAGLPATAGAESGEPSDARRARRARPARARR